MKRKLPPIIFWGIVLMLVFCSFCFSLQQRQRAPWEDRSPRVGRTVPDVNIYDEELNSIPFSNLYKNTLLIVQWGGCT